MTESLIPIAKVAIKFYKLMKDFVSRKNTTPITTRRLSFAQQVRMGSYLDAATAAIYLPQVNQKKMAESKSEVNKSTAKNRFEVNDIVFLLNAETGMEDRIRLGGSMEIDLKVYSWVQNAEGVYFYELISGFGERLGAVRENRLVPARDRFLFSEHGYVISEVDTELFPKGSIFHYRDKYLCNDQYGVYIHETRFKTLLNLFDITKFKIKL